MKAIHTGWNAGSTKTRRSGQLNNKTIILKTISLFRDKPAASIFMVAVGFILYIALLPACKNDVQKVLSLDISDTMPELTAKDIEIYYSEKARVQIKLVSPYLVNKMEDEPLLIFPDGFTVYFYDSAMNVQSTITADYGVSYEKKKIMEARHNVVVENMEKGEKLNTEELFWDRGKQLIYSNKFVRLTTGEQVLTGDGLNSEEPFDVLIILNPKGPIEIKEDQ
jgi:LPS export ABC transporter protein LptC